MSTPDGWIWVEGEKPRFAAHLHGLGPGPWEVPPARRPRTHRSTQANKRYWALITVGAREVGYDVPEELHEGLAMKLLALPPDERTKLPRRRSTTKLSPAEFSEYVDAAERFLRMELGCELRAWDEETERLERGE